MLSIFAICFYIGAWVFLAHSIVKKESFSPRNVTGVIGAGIVCHLGATYFLLHTDGGVQLGLFKISSLFMVVINIIVWFSGLKKPLHNLFLGLLPLSVIAILASLSFASPITKSETLSGGVISHILLSILAYSLLTIASLQALLLAYQNKKLRSKHPVSIIGLMPPLQTMETLLFELIWGGMLFLSLSIVTGFIFIDDFMAQQLSHKTIFSILSWVLYAILLAGRTFLGWRGMTAIRWTLGAFTALMLAYVGSKLVIEVIL